MNKQLHARKRRQFKSLCKQLNRLMQGEHNTISKKKIETTLFKIKHLLRELSGIIARWEMKKTLGTAAVVFGLATTSVQGQSFVEPVENPFGLSASGFFSAPVFADLDNDGDLDILVGEINYNNFDVGVFRYYENTGTISEPSFGAGKISPFGLQSQSNYAIIPTVADLDNDGDLDILVGTYEYNSNEYGSVFQYYENEGTANNPSYSAPKNDPFGITSLVYFAAPVFADLDSDGDIDLLTSTYGYSYQNGNYSYYSFLYYENTGDVTSPQFLAPVESPFGLSFPPNTYSYIAFPTITDLDLDGDLDILCGLSGYHYNNGVEYDNGIFYFENIGSTINPQFDVSERNPLGINIPSTVQYQFLVPALADLDNDGDSDFLGADVAGSFFYYENALAINTTSPQVDFAVSLSPNPTNNYLNINTAEALTQIEIYDLSGRQLAAYDGQQTQISIEDLSSGTYILRLTNREGEYLSRRIEKS